jgi:hypothetical protein
MFLVGEQASRKEPAALMLTPTTNPPFTVLVMKLLRLVDNFFDIK